MKDNTQTKTSQALPRFPCIENVTSTRPTSALQKVPNRVAVRSIAETAASLVSQPLVN
jgi:hypothetical protein